MPNKMKAFQAGGESGAGSASADGNEGCDAECESLRFVAFKLLHQIHLIRHF